jgi:hypothetical protein
MPAHRISLGQCAHRGGRYQCQIVDRLDYSKGVPDRIRAFGHFLASELNHPFRTTAPIVPSLSVRPQSLPMATGGRYNPCRLNENVFVWLCLRQQPSSQPPTHRRARSPMAKRRQGSQSQPAPAEQQGGPPAKNSDAFYSPLPRRDKISTEKIVI